MSGTHYLPICGPIATLFCTWRKYICPTLGKIFQIAVTTEFYQPRSQNWHNDSFRIKYLIHNILLSVLSPKFILNQRLFHRLLTSTYCARRLQRRSCKTIEHRWSFSVSTDLLRAMRSCHWIPEKGAFARIFPKSPCFDGELSSFWDPLRTLTGTFPATSPRGKQEVRWQGARRKWRHCAPSIGEKLQVYNGKTGSGVWMQSLRNYSGKKSTYAFFCRIMLEKG